VLKNTVKLFLLFVHAVKQYIDMENWIIRKIEKKDNEAVAQ
jgi:hypothetical protein